jgi:ATP-dependent Lhr-like helicase
MSNAFEKLDPKIREAVWELGWDSLRQLQVDSIEAVLQSRDHVILAAATASGKTEAAFLPILSLMVAERRSSVQALYISPLVALINDQFGRLESLCEKADIAVHRRHGGVNESERQRMMKNPSGVLLITPESLEALFIRRGRELSRLFCGLQFVVIDELHSFLDNVRGTHLFSLLKRLEVASGTTPRYFGLSATLGDFTQAKAFLSRENPSMVRVIEDSSHTKNVRVSLKSYIRRKPPRGKPHNPEALPDPTATIAEDIAFRCRTGSHLVFCNARVQAELLTDNLHNIVRRERWTADPFVLHHGSISKDLRQEAEETLKSGRQVTAVCTSTLEMGIDIGSVKTVCQVGPPWSVASLTQRVGRSGRKEDESQILRLYTIDEELTAESKPSERLYPELVRAIALVELLSQKWVEGTAVSRAHYSTCIHQVLSVLRQTGGCHAVLVYDLLCVKGAFSRIPEKDFVKLLRSMSQKGLIAQMNSGEIILAPAGEEIVEARDFYAAFVTAIEYSVESHGERLGLLPLDSLPNVTESLLLAGRRWQVEAIYHDQRQVIVIPSKGYTPPKFIGKGGLIDPRVMAQMREILTSTKGFDYLEQTSVHFLEDARSFLRRCNLAEVGIAAKGGDIVWFPWGGTRAHEALTVFARADEIVASKDLISVTYHDCPLDLFRAHCQKVASGAIPINGLDKLSVLLERDRFDQYVSRELLEKAFLTETLDLSAARQLAASMANGSVPSRPEE